MDYEIFDFHTHPFYDEDDMDIYCEDIYNLERVVEIPTPHGRLIDADQVTLECQWCSLDDAPTILEAEE